jgi:hypothetical protein
MSEFIFSKLLDKVSDASANINEYFNNFDTYNANIYNILDRLPKHNIVFYIFIVLIIFNLIRPYEIKLNHILTFLICILLIYYLINKDYFNANKFILSKKKKLDFLHKLMFNEKNWSYALEGESSFKPAILTKQTYLFQNPLLVELLFDCRNYIQYNVAAYISCLHHCNNVVGLDYESRIGLNSQYQNYTVAVDESKKALNEFQTIIYQLEPLSELSFKIFLENRTKLHGLLNEHLYNIGVLFKQKNKLRDLDNSVYPDNFFEMNFEVAPNNTGSKGYISTYNMF